MFLFCDDEYPLKFEIYTITCVSVEVFGFPINSLRHVVIIEVVNILIFLSTQRRKQEVCKDLRGRFMGLYKGHVYRHIFNEIISFSQII